jgi:LacI family transcriptional regulator
MRRLRWRAAKLNQTRTIGMLITASTNPFYSELVRGVERSCFERGYSLVLCNTEGDEQRMNRNLETLMQKRVDGLLLLCTETHQPSKEIIQRYPSIPTVMMDWAPFDGTSDLIQDNSLLGGDMATQYLIDKGIPALPVLPGRWIKPRRVCVWKGISPRWNGRGLPFLMAIESPV